MKITDAVALLDGGRVNDAGYLEVNARTARTGVQQYLGAELGRPDLDVVNVYRDAAEVFSKRALDTFSKIPVTNDHPAAPVTAENWKDVAVGTTGDEVLRDGEFLKIGLKITDAAAVRAVKDGKRELSVGYSTEIVWGDGVAPDGTAYQARQTNIVADHIAIVACGRAGASVRIGDGAASWGAAPLTTDHEGKRMTTRTVMVDGLSVETTDAGVTAIEKLTKDRDTARADLVAASTAHAAVLAAKDEEIGTLKADLQKAKDATPKPADLDRLAAERASLLTAARALDAQLVTDGKTDSEIRRAVVVGKLGDGFKDAPDAEILGAFRALSKDVKPRDPAAQVFGDAVGTPLNANDGWDTAASSAGVKLKKVGA